MSEETANAMADALMEKERAKIVDLATDLIGAVDAYKRAYAPHIEGGFCWTFSQGIKDLRGAVLAYMCETIKKEGPKDLNRKL